MIHLHPYPGSCSRSSAMAPLVLEPCKKWRLNLWRRSHLIASFPNDDRLGPWWESWPCKQVQGFAKDDTHVPYLDRFAKVGSGDRWALCVKCCRDPEWQEGSPLFSSTFSASSTPLILTHCLVIKQCVVVWFLVKCDWTPQEHVWISSCLRQTSRYWTSSVSQLLSCGYILYCLLLVCFLCTYIGCLKHIQLLLAQRWKKKRNNCEHKTKLNKWWEIRQKKYPSV